MYIYCLLPIAYCLLPIAYCLLYIYIAYCLLSIAVAAVMLALHPRSAGDHELEVGFMRHGHEMLWFLRWSFSESELPLSYNAKVTNARMRASN